MSNYLPSMTALRCLDASARLLSFTKAAEEMHLTQGAVSHHILQLEKQLGVQFFTRRRAGLELTLAGQKYWNDVVAVLRLLERATESIATTGGRGGTLNLSVSSSFANYWLMPRLPAFVRANPDITLNLSTRVGPVDFAASQDDASIEFCTGPTPGIEASLVSPLVLYPFMSREEYERFKAERKIRGVSLSKDQLLDLLKSFALIRRVTVPEAWPGWLQEVGLSGALPESNLQGGPRYALLSMALAGAIEGLGIALLPHFIVSNAVQSRQLVCLSRVPWIAARGYYLRWPEWRSDLDALKRFSAWLSALPSETPDEPSEI
ncbi:LysR family transcriptional regulator [Cupriavidus necator]|jgi:DNA-binding transcriptional LysR family regulator|uniref:LysR family transcriptional regulator n=1 Tax=Cupriavidus necator TaxID=106590 RepID=UPI0039C05AB7